MAASTITIKTFAAKESYESSAVVTGFYEILHSSTAAAAPEFNYQSGIYDTSYTFIPHLSQKLAPAISSYLQFLHSAGMQ